MFFIRNQKRSINFYLNIHRCPLVDDWPSYNESLVMRGEILLDLDLLQSWGEELEEMNRGKEGGRYRYPQSLIELQALPKHSSASPTASWRASPTPSRSGNRGSEHPTTRPPGAESTPSPSTWSPASTPMSG